MGWGGKFHATLVLAGGELSSVSNIYLSHGVRPSHSDTDWIGDVAKERGQAGRLRRTWGQKLMTVKLTAVQSD
jgi:hypothetical protein